jgi:hypothetical protein
MRFPDLLEDVMKLHARVQELASIVRSLDHEVSEIKYSLRSVVRSEAPAKKGKDSGDQTQPTLPSV